MKIQGKAQLSIRSFFRFPRQGKLQTSLHYSRQPQQKPFYSYSVVDEFYFTTISNALLTTYVVINLCVLLQYLAI